jgi:hypothetical protein
LVPVKYGTHTKCISSGQQEFMQEIEINMNCLQELCWYMHQQGLLDRQEFLQAVLEMVEKSKNPEDPLFRLLMPTLLRQQTLSSEMKGI